MQKSIITFIGAGNMTYSLIGGLITDGYSAKYLWATNPGLDALQNLHTEFGIHTTQSNQEGARAADVIVLAVKPSLLKTVALEIAPIVQKQQALVLSIAAGVREKDLRRWLGEKTAIVRCMPNTPALVKSGATGLCANSNVSPEQKNLAESVLRAVGITVWLSDEEQLDIVTALSGCGPAYFFRIMEALEKSAEISGLSAETAHLLTLQTTLGAARMALESQKTLSELRKQVTSPGGSTECALQVLETSNPDKLFGEILNAAKKRTAELAELFGA